jgi:hypothetical protein
MTYTSPYSARPAGRSSSAAGLFWFMLLSLTGLCALASAVLLPEYAALLELEGRRDALAHQVQCEQRLAAYNDRLIRAMETDPVLRTRLMMRHCNYRPARFQTLPVDLPPAELAVPSRILQEAMLPPAPREDAFAAAGRRLSDPLQRTGVVVVSLLMVAAALFFFAPRTETPTR